MHKIPKCCWLSFNMNSFSEGSVSSNKMQCFLLLAKALTSSLCCPHLFYHRRNNMLFKLLSSYPLLPVPTPIPKNNC